MSGKVSQEKFYQSINELILPGDVINFDSKTAWYKILFRIAYWGIRRHHKRLFGRLGRWRDTHTMLYLDDDHVFSVEPPQCRWWKLKELNDEHISVWRYTKQGFSDHDIGIMCYAARQMIGRKYDKGQLVDFMINEAMGYPDRLKYHIFESGKKQKVCSTGVRVCFEYLRKMMPQSGRKRLFSNYKDPAYEQSPRVKHMNEKGRGVDVEATAPGHFANSHFFDDEFELIAIFRYGILDFQNAHPPRPSPVKGKQAPLRVSAPPLKGEAGDTIRAV
jgi:hypothetical protein